MSAAQTLECAYGYEMKTPDDRMLKTIETTAMHLEKAIMPTGKFQRRLSKVQLQLLSRFLGQHTPLVESFPIMAPWYRMEESSSGMARGTSKYG